MSIGILIVVVVIGLIFLYGMVAVRKMKNMPSVESSSKIFELDDRNFRQITQKGVTLIDFWAEWCMPCKMMAPVLNELADEVDDKYKICKVNIEQSQSLAKKYSVRSIPTLLLLKDGKELHRFVGVKQKDFLLKQLIQA